MSRSRGSKMDDKRSALRRVWRTPGEEKAVQVSVTNGLLLAHHEERHGKICKRCHSCKVQANLIHTHP